MNVCAKILSMLDREGCRYDVIRHAAMGETAQASIIRGHDLREAAKSLVLEAATRQSDEKTYFLAVVPGHKRVDLKFLRQALNVKRLQFAPEDKARELTGCPMGAVPPFTFHHELKVIMDMAIAETERMVFNAGELDFSVAMPTRDYLRIVQCKQGYYTQQSIVQSG